MPEARLSEYPLPVNGGGQLSTGWWGMLCLLATEGILFGYLLFSYGYLGSQAGGEWPPGGPPSLRLALPNTILLIASSVVLEVGSWRHRAGRLKSMLPVLLLTALMGAAFVLVQISEWSNKTFTFSSNAYGGAYFLLTGFHLAHVVAGLVALLALAVWAWQRRLPPGGRLPLALGRIYWHFVDAVWLAVFTTIYVVPQQP